MSLDLSVLVEIGTSLIRCGYGGEWMHPLFHSSFTRWRVRMWLMRCKIKRMGCWFGKFSGVL
jgi:hypothetical protein